MITGTYPHVSQWRAEAIEQGKVQERIESVLRILAQRDIRVSEDDKTAIEGCSDMETLEVWFNRALVIDDIKDLFAV
jgi:hypothetical protein